AFISVIIKSQHKRFDFGKHKTLFQKEGRKKVQKKHEHHTHLNLKMFLKMSEVQIHLPKYIQLLT
ncbi:MAG: hypothetical protein KAS18_07040, partial [Calditrichia bacterium]|nr:hypothetical protein [Calditrichia bacterium]